MRYLPARGENVSLLEAVSEESALGDLSVEEGSAAQC